MSNKPRISNIGAAICHLCKVDKADCIKIKKNFFSSLVLCDSCGNKAFRHFNGNISGRAKNE